MDSWILDGRNSYVAEQFDKAHGYLDISVTGYGQTLKGAFYSNSGSTRDIFIIKKTQDPVPESIEKDLFSLTVKTRLRSRYKLETQRLPQYK